MKRRLLFLLIVALVAFMVAAPAFAEHGDPVGGCLVTFELHHFMEHAEHPDHHIGLAMDINGDGWICMRPVAFGLHVHMDNVLPLP